MSAPNFLTSPWSTNMFAPKWASVTPQLPGWCDVEFDFDPLTITVGSGLQSLRNQLLVDGDTDYLAREIIALDITPRSESAINPQELKVRLTDGDGQFITSDWVTLNDLNGPVGPAVLPFRKGSKPYFDIWNQSGITATVLVGFKGWKRIRCDAKQADLPQFVPQSRRFCKPWAPGIRFEEYEYFFEFLNGATGAGQTPILFNEEGNCMTVASVGGASGTIQIGQNALLPNTAFSLTVVGNAITIVLATNAFSNITTTLADLITAINTTPASSAIALATAIPPGDAFGLPTVPTGILPFSPAGNATAPPWALNLQPQTPNQVFQQVPLQTDDDAAFLWRGTCGQIMSLGGAAPTIPGNCFLRFLDPGLVPLAREVPRPNLVPSLAGPGAEIVLSNGGGRMSPAFSEIYIPRGALVFVDIALMTANTVSLQMSLRGVKVYGEDKCNVPRPRFL